MVIAGLQSLSACSRVPLHHAGRSERSRQSGWTFLGAQSASFGARSSFFVKLLASHAVDLIAEKCSGYNRGSFAVTFLDAMLVN